MNWIFCLFRKCRHVSQYETKEGIGGKCDHCGRIHGWLTREQLRRYADFQEWLECQRKLSLLHSMEIDGGRWKPQPFVPSVLDWK